MPSQLSQSPLLTLAATAFATIFVGFGVNAIFRPEHGLTFFELDPPSQPADKAVVDKLMIVYGARDIFMGAALYATAYFGDRRALGWTLIAGSAVAAVDGLVCKMN